MTARAQEPDAADHPLQHASRIEATLTELGDHFLADFEGEQHEGGRAERDQHVSAQAGGLLVALAVEPEAARRRPQPHIKRRTSMPTETPSSRYAAASTARDARDREPEARGSTGFAT